MDDLCNKLICTRNENLFDVEDIIINILSRLPVKSLMICKSVSKQWWRLISSPNFTRLQLIRSQENPIYVFYPYSCRCHSEHFLTKIDGETTETLPGCNRRYFKGMICSFNGLICCINTEGIRCISIRTSLRLDIHIRNPATREVLLLPQSRGSKESPKIGVAFYPRTNEYKVFQFFNPAGKSHDKHSECEVYSSITGCWKGIGCVAHSPWSSNHICINGTVYWFIRSEKNGLIIVSILAVDMEENFSVISIPEEATLHTFLVSFEGCLSLVAGNVFDKNRFDMWILQDSKKSTWVRKCSDYMPILNIKQVKHVAVQKNEILFASMKQYFFYNMCSRTWREFNWVHDFRKRLSIPLAYTESLLPCKCWNWFSII